MFNQEITLKYLWEATRRHLMLIMLTTVIITAGAVIFALKLPNIYQSDTMILVEPQQSVQTSPGKISITTTIEKERLATLSQEILSRNHLEKIILETDIYNGLSMEQRVRTMRENMQLDIVRPDSSGSVGGFKISFQYADALQVAAVTNRVASLFIDENKSEREQQLKDKLRFLEEQQLQARVRLQDEEEKLRMGRQRHPSVLPEERGKNMKMVEQLNEQLSSNREALNRAQQQRDYLENKILEYQSAPKPTVKPKEIIEPPKPPTAIERQLEETRSQLNDLKNRYTNEHPDVARTSRRIAELEEKHKAELRQSAAAAAKAAATEDLAIPEEKADPVAQLNSQLSSITPELEHRKAEQGRLQSQLGYYQSRRTVVPAPAIVPEQEAFISLRDYNTAKDNYQAISNEILSVKMDQDLERQQRTMLFRVVDVARVPERPIKPNRQLIGLVGLLLGFGAGLGLAFYREFSDESLHTEQEVEAALKLDVLATISKV